jgi:ribonuclease P protein component
MRVRSGPVRLSYLPLATSRPQLAFAVGRRFGTAPERNRARRRLRAAFDTAWSSLPGPAAGAYLVTADRSVLALGFDRLVASLRSCLIQVVERAPAVAAGLPASTADRPDRQPERAV